MIRAGKGRELNEGLTRGRGGGEQIEDVEWRRKWRRDGIRIGVNERLTRAATSIWFEILGSWFRVKKISIFPGKFTKNFDFSGKSCSFTATSGQIFLFLFKSHHFRTYFLYMIRCNNISRPVHDPHDPSCDPSPRPPVPNLGIATPTPRIDASELDEDKVREIWSENVVKGLQEANEEKS